MWSSQSRPRPLAGNSGPNAGVGGEDPHPARVEAGQATKYGFCLPTAAEALGLDVPLRGGRSRQSPELFLKRKFGRGVNRGYFIPDLKLRSRLSSSAVVWSNFSTELCQKVKCVSCGRHGTINRVEHQSLSRPTHTCVWSYGNRIWSGTHPMIRITPFNEAWESRAVWGFFFQRTLEK